MNLLQLLKARLNRDISVSELAERIADRSFELVWRAVQGRVLTLAPAEARGYVRARARGILQQAIDAQRVAAGFEDRVYALALDRTLRRIADQAHAIESRYVARAA